MTDEATRIQNEAADPQRSTWLSANAGSGKTRVLTDRVARLLLRGTRPQDILCLTYTKAAASEMQNRLFRTLGRWAMMPDETLTEALATIGESSAADLERARTLFARAIETPGGLRIQTIHSFCAGLLRQFPVEAGVTPEFRELDSDQASELLARAVEQMAEIDAPELMDFLSCHDGDALDVVCTMIAGARTSFAALPDAVELSLRVGTVPEHDLALIDETLLRLIRPGWWFALRAAISGTGVRNDAVAARMSVDPITLTREDVGWLDDTFANATNDNSKAGKWPSRKIRDGLSPWEAEIDAFLDGVIERRRARRAIETRDNTIAMHAFATALLARYDTLKRAGGVLDFDDLIEKTSGLLRDDMRAWVRYRLDGRIEHILVDEAQDTSPSQWEVIAALADEIVSGKGAGSRDRSLFVVGDRKQSIYSFQGADARAFDAMQMGFSERMKDGPAPLSQHRLEHSFRSSAAILAATDAVLDHLADETRPAERHTAFFADMPGRVDLWPAVEPGDAPDDVPWFDPVDRPLEEEAQVRLADAVAHEIKRMIEEEAVPTPKDGPRPVVAGDILVLVQRRGLIFDRIIRTAQAIGVDIAGPDRLRLKDELAVKDILSFLRFLSLPQDDLSLAEALRSPIIGFDEARLYDLAQGREARHLWPELVRRKAEFADAHEILADLLAQSDFLRPYEMIERLLIRHSGRNRLVGRLGPDAEDAIDELLSLALRFEETSVPDLTSFLVHFETLEADVKRAADASGRKVRVMTVHGAKGLEAPIVFLPDTIRVARSDQSPLFFDEDGTPWLRSPSKEATDIQNDAKAVRAAAERAEAERLLYVAMTRAETWLVVCGAKSRRKGGFWHDAVSEAFSQNESVRDIDTPTGPGKRLAHGDWPTRVGVRPDAGTTPLPPPELANLPDAKRSAIPINPSDLGGSKSIGGRTKRDDPRAWGTAIHLLLEHLPSHPSSEWAMIGERLLSNAGEDFSGVDPAEAVSVASDVIGRHPDLFGPDVLREVPIAGHMNAMEVAGTVDLMQIDGDTVRIVDFKTNAEVPLTPEVVPEAILRQMGAYLFAIRAALPDHTPELSVLWTEDGSLMPLPHGIVSDAFNSSTTS